GSSVASTRSGVAPPWRCVRQILRPRRAQRRTFRSMHRARVSSWRDSTVTWGIVWARHAAGTIGHSPSQGPRDPCMDPVVITALDQEGRGITRVDGKAVFVEGALTGECVSIEVFHRKPKYEQA